MIKKQNNKFTKRTLWAGTLFYILIAFEFLYMASPFALYFYSIYTPGMNFLNQSPALSWLMSFFLPHIVNETKFILIDLRNIFGFILALTGFLTFCIGAIQVYYYKLAKKGAVTGGIYNLIRHPQYASLIICGFGLLILWPRFIVLLIFLAMLFIYYFLAKYEESECEEKFGQSYIDYKNKTAMFLPFKIPFLNAFPKLPGTALGNAVYIVILYSFVAIISIGIAKLVQKKALGSLYTFNNLNALYLATNKIEIQKMKDLVQIAFSDKKVAFRIQNENKNNNINFLNYIVPSNLFISEIPMNIKENSGSLHFLGNEEDNNTHYKIIFTKAVLRTDQREITTDMLLNIKKRIPILEVWIDLEKRTILKNLNPPLIERYENVPLPVY